MHTSKTKIPKHISQGIIDTIVVTLMTVSPTLIGIGAALVKSKFTNFNPQYKSGEFLLYAVSFLCAAYLVFSEKTNGRKDWKSNANSFIFIIVLLVSGFYGTMVAVENPDINVLKLVSILAICISLPTFLFSQIINNANSPDIGAQRNGESQVIEDALK